MTETQRLAIKLILYPLIALALGTMVGLAFWPAIVGWVTTAVGWLP